MKCTLRINIFRTWLSTDKLIPVVRWLLVFLYFLFIYAPGYAHAYAQKITLHLKNAPVEKVFKEITRQSGFRFIYTSDKLAGVKPISVNVDNATLEETLDQCEAGQPITFMVIDDYVVIKHKEVSVPAAKASIPAKIISVSGTVTSAHGPVVGATVMVKKTGYITTTDQRGFFNLAEVEDDATLVITSVSHLAREVKLDGQIILNIKLEEKVGELDDAIVVAYGTTTQRKNVGAVAVVKGEQIETLPNRSFDRSLQGLVPGLLVTSGNGQPGGGVSNFILRGIGTGTAATFGSSVRNPLIVIDGVPVMQDNFQRLISQDATPITNPLAQLNTNDIESVSILKDASAIALYGTRASNGVIVVSTKKGKLGKAKISIRHQTDVASQIKGGIDVLNQDEYLTLLYESYKNSNPTLWTDQAIKNDLKAKFPNQILQSSDTAFYKVPNLFSEIFTNNATTISNDISISGGVDKYLYYFNISHLKQNGVVKKTGYERASMRYNFINQPASWLSVGLNSTLTYSLQDHAGYNDNSGDVLGLVYTISPLNPIRLSDGTYYSILQWGTTGDAVTKSSNPVASMEYNINQARSYHGLGNLFGEISLFNHLKLKCNVGSDIMFSDLKEKVDPRIISPAYGVSTIGIGSIQERQIRRNTTLVTNTLKYDREIINRHHFDLLLGQEAQETNVKTISVTSTGFSSPYYSEAINGSTRTGVGTSSKETFISFFGQMNYGFLNRYFFTLSGRRDGSSKFGIRERYGDYWSIGSSTILSDLYFFKKIENILNYLKIRGSVGTSGNSSAVGSTVRFDLLTPANYSGNSALWSAGNPRANPNIKWEKTMNLDFGIEAKLFNNKLNIIADLYRRKVTDLIYTVSLPGATGFLSILDGIGSMENKGVEISLSTNFIRKKNFFWSFNITWSSNKNKLIKANQPLTASGNLINLEGKNFNSFYLVKWAGVDPLDGKPQWYDTIGNITKSYSLTNRVIVGKPQPDGFGGITNTIGFKNVELSAFFYYQYGFQVYDNNMPILLNDGSSFPLINQSKQSLDRWSKSGDVASNPRRVLNNADGGTNASTRYLFDGKFIRLKNVNLSYKINSSLARLLKFNSMRVFFQGNNLAIWTNYKGIDIESVNANGGIGFSYPQQRSFSLGLNIDL